MGNLFERIAGEIGDKVEAEVQVKVLFSMPPAEAVAAIRARVTSSASAWLRSRMAMAQLAAVGAVYFILALLSSGNSGRLSAWFGGLVLVVLALGKVASGELKATVKNLAGPEVGGKDTQSDAGE